MRTLQLLHAIPVAIACLAADQLAKLLVAASLPICQKLLYATCPHHRLGPLTLVRVQNLGTAYTFLRSPAIAFALGLVGCLLVFVYAFAYIAWLRRVTWAAVLGIGLQAGGASSNLLDRIVANGAYDYIKFPGIAFNVADLCLLVGMVLATGSIAMSLVGPGARLPLRPRRGPGAASSGGLSSA